MEGWKEYKIGEFLKINPKISLTNNTKYSFVEMKDLKENIKYVNPSNFKTLKGGSRFQNGDTLFARITPCLQNGKICQVQNLKDGLGFGSTEFLVFRGIESISNSDFVYYLSKTPVFRKFAESKMIGTSGRQRVPKESFNFLNIPLPPLPEQKAIAAILSAIDDKIELNLKTNKTLEDMAMALYKHWFVDFGPFQDGNFVESELGLIPEGWEVKKLGEVAKFKNGKGLKKQFRNNGGPYPIYGSNGVIGSTTEMLFDQSVVAIGRVGANYGEIHYSLEPCWISDNAVTAQPNRPHYFWWLLQSLRRMDYSNFAGGSAQPLITQRAIKQESIVYAGDKILSAVSNKLQSIFLMLNSNNLESQTLTQLRDTMLPKLISGEIRLKEFRNTIAQVL